MGESDCYFFRGRSKFFTVNDEHAILAQDTSGLPAPLIPLCKMSSRIQTLRVVVASPADVQAERDRVPVVLEELNKSMGTDREIRLELARWETDAFPGFHAAGPQGLIDPILEIEGCGVLIGIFWKRFGTPTDDGKTGAEHEFEVAYETWKKHGRPQVMVYFSQKPYSPQSKEETDQWGRVLEFRKSFPKEGLWWPYRGTAKFETLLRMHLSNYIRQSFPLRQTRELDAEPGGSTRTSIPRPAPSRQPDYFAVQARIIEEYSRSFVGRATAIQAFDDFLNTQGRGYFVLSGGPGQGKTAFSCHLVKRGNYVHHFISRTGGRTDPRLILRSLVSQLLALAERAALIPESISELTKLFEELLLELSKNGERVVIVVDALDELPPDMVEDPPYFVTETLPDSVFVVVSSRPGERLDRMQALLFDTPQRFHDLEPLNLDEMTLILRSRKPGMTIAEAERIAEVSQGNPLYLRAVLDQLETDPTYDLHSLPTAVEGFYQNSTKALGASGAVLHDTLAVLSAARAPLSLGNLAGITGNAQRKIDDLGIRPVRQFLVDIDGGYTFYHARFHEFVTRTLLFSDEIRKAHSRIAEWLIQPESHANAYRLASLGYHIFQSGDHEAFLKTIDDAFLADKVRQLGYAVLEDVELLTSCLLAKGDPAVISRCVSLVEGLGDIVGDDLVTEAVDTMQPYRAGPSSFRTRMFAPSVESVPGVDVYVAVLPKGEVSADFFEILPVKGNLVVAIGDAPAIGLKSAFVARFIATLFRALITQSQNPSGVITEIDKRIVGYDYFQNVSMQCMDVDPKRQIAKLVNAGHPYPVHYSAKTGNCDVLPIRGPLLASSADEHFAGGEFQAYSLSINPGDMLVMISDGITEAHLLQGDPYGYRFTEVIRARAREGATAVGQAIVDDWRIHPRESDWADDVSVITISIR